MFAVKKVNILKVPVFRYLTAIKYPNWCYIIIFKKPLVVRYDKIKCPLIVPISREATHTENMKIKTFKLLLKIRGKNKKSTKILKFT